MTSHPSPPILPEPVFKLACPFAISLEYVVLPTGLIEREPAWHRLGIGGRVHGHMLPGLVSICDLRCSGHIPFPWVRLLQVWGLSRR